MKQILLLVCVAVFAVLAWRVTESMSSDALALAIGVVFGVLSGLPTAVLVLADRRRREPAERPAPPEQNYIVMMTEPQRSEQIEVRR